MKAKRIRWRAKALADLQAFHDWLATVENARPKRTIARIRAAARSMQRLGDIGKPSRIEGVRELSVRNAPYVIVYRVDGDVIGNWPSITRRRIARTTTPDPRRA